MITDNIFGNDILNGNLNNSLVTELGQENISLNITPQESSFIDIFTQELPLIETKIINENDENSIDNNSSFKNSSSANYISSSNIDPLIGGDVQQFQVNNIEVNDTSFAPPLSELEFLGGFGDYNSGNDITLEIKDAEGNVVETFSLSGEGQGAVYKDNEFEYVFFSDTDETTSVEISSLGNLKLNDYFGDSLKVETAGSITAQDIVLVNEDETGLVLRSGLGDEQNIGVEGYSVVDLGLGEAWNINNLGQVVGETQSRHAFLYSDGVVTDLGGGYARGINDFGQVIGSFAGDGGSFLYSDGQITDIGIPTDNYSGALAINNSGQIAGFYWDISENFRGGFYPYLYEEGNIIQPLGGGTGIFANGVAYSINNLGQVVGQKVYPIGNDFAYYPFLYSNGETKNLGFLSPNAYSRAYDINDSGQVVGYSGSRAFLYSEGQMTDIGDGEAYGINDFGQIVGSSRVDSSSRAFLYSEGQRTDLNSLIFSELGWNLAVARAINNRGQIVGYGILGGEKHAFLLNPITFTSQGSEITVGNISTFGDTVLLQGGEINVTGEAITTNGGDITFDGKTKINSNLTIDSSGTENNIITGGDITFTKTVDAASAGSQNLTLKAGTGNILFQDVIGGNGTFNNINVLGAKTVTANADIIGSNLIKINATEDITAKNITSENGRVLLTSEQKSITALDITSGSGEGDNLVIKAGDSIQTANLSAHQLGVVKLSSGTYSKEDTSLISNVSTGSITGKQVQVESTGSLTATEDITAYDGKVEITTIKDINTKKIESLTKSIKLISIEGAVTIDGNLSAQDNGIAIIAANDITTQTIHSVDGIVGLSSYQGSVIVEDDINTVKGGVVIAGKEGVEVAKITTGIGEVNLSSAGDIIANGNISTNVGYVDIKSNKNILTQGVTTNKGYIEIAAKGIASTASLITSSGVISKASGSDFIDDEIIIAGNLKISLFSSNISTPQALTEEQEEVFTEFVQELWYRTRPLAEFVLGALYQWTYTNGDEIRQFLPGFLKLSEQEETRFNNILNESEAFELGRLLGNGAAVAQGIMEFIAGAAVQGGGTGLCFTGIGCPAGAPAIATGVILQVHGAKLAVNAADDLGQQLSDLLSPNRMESSGGADDVIGLSRETGISQDSINNVYGDLSSEDIKLLGDKLGKNLAEPLFNQGNKDFVSDVTESVKLVGDDLDAIEGIQTTLRNNKIPEEFKIDAFSELVEFLNKYKNKVSGEFAFRFGKANVPETAPLEMAKQSRGARGEINSAIDILEGNTILGNTKSLKAIPENKLPNGSTTPDFLVTSVDDSIRLAEIKTPKGNISANNIKRQIRDATRSIRQSSEVTTDNGLIRIDYGQASPTDWNRERIFNEIKRGLLQTDPQSGLKGTDIVEFVEFTYKDLNNNGVQKILVQVKNGIINIIN